MRAFKRSPCPARAPARGPAGRSTLQCVAATAVSLALLAVCVSFRGAHARAYFGERLPNAHSVPCPPGQNSKCSGGVCYGLGHTSCAGGTKTLNPFGEAFRDAGLTWTKALCMIDSDGDGRTNGQELGDPCCVWDPVTNPGALDPNWEISHPGFASATNTGQALPSEAECAALREEVGVIAPDKDPSRFFNDGEEQAVLEFSWHVKLTDDETQYYDVDFNLPVDETYWIVGFETIVDNAAVMHHTVTNRCPEPVNEHGSIVRAMPGTARTGCEENMYAWAPGGLTGNHIPSNAGFRAGKDSAAQGISINLHYNNAAKEAGLEDKSGMRIYISRTRRDEELGILWLGPIAEGFSIPPGQKSWYATSACTIEVDEDIAPNGITVTGYGNHAHYIATSLLSERIVYKQNPTWYNPNPGFKVAEELAREDEYHFDKQYWTNYDQPRILRSRDTIITTCTFDSTTRDYPTYAGYGTNDEMCTQLFTFYPANALYYRGCYTSTAHGVWPKDARSALDVYTPGWEILMDALVRTRPYLCTLDSLSDAALTWQTVYNKFIEAESAACEHIAVHDSIHGDNPVSSDTDISGKDRMCSASCGDFYFRLSACIHAGTHEMINSFLWYPTAGNKATKKAQEVQCTAHTERMTSLLKEAEDVIDDVDCDAIPTPTLDGATSAITAACDQSAHGGMDSGVQCSTHCQVEVATALLCAPKSTATALVQTVMDVMGPACSTFHAELDATLSERFKGGLAGFAHNGPLLQEWRDITLSPSPHQEPPILNEGEADDYPLPSAGECVEQAAHILAPTRVKKKIAVSTFMEQMFDAMFDGGLPDGIDATPYEDACTSALTSKKNKKWMKFRKGKVWRVKDVPAGILYPKPEDVDCATHAAGILTELKVWMQFDTFMGHVSDAISLPAEVDRDPYDVECTKQLKKKKNKKWLKIKKSKIQLTGPVPASITDASGISDRS